MARLVVTLLGGFQVEMDGHPLTDFKSNKVRALLAYLACEGDRPHRREVLAGLLWPDRTDSDALGNLRYSLASLRRSLDDRSQANPFLLVTHDTIAFNRDSAAWLDVMEFQRRLEAAQAQWRAGQGADDLQAALALYRGGLLEGFSVNDAAPFEEWAVLRREQLAQHVIAALGDVVAVLEERHDYKQAQYWAKRLVSLEPWNEQAHRALMRTLALDGQRSAALHQYQACSRILLEELGIEPTEETAALYETIRAGRFPGQAVQGRHHRAAGSPVGAPGRGQSHPQPHRPPADPPPVPVVAREKQLAQLHSALGKALAGEGRVFFVTGEAGSGKTALIAEFARRALQAQPQLLVAGGQGSDATGISDPYLPFRELLQLLTGDVEAQWAGAALSREHAHRLWTAMPDAVQVLAEQGPNLVHSFVPGASLLERSEAFARQSGDGSWLRALNHLLEKSTVSRGARQPVSKDAVFEDVTQVLQALARRRPLCLVLDDLQWADTGTISLLFHLGRRLAASRILLVGAYRPDALTPPPTAGRHPLELVVNELSRISGEAPIDLDGCEGREFIAALLDSTPHYLSAEFGELLFQHTEGQPLFTVELLKSMEERGELMRDPGGRWVEGPALHWDRLPSRVEAAIAERLGRLPNRCRALLTAASVEGEDFTAEVAARAAGMDERSAAECLSDSLAHRHRVVMAIGVRRIGAQKLSRYRFRHHLFQQYLYTHLDAVERPSLHETIGEALETLYRESPDELETLAPRLAWHFESAGWVDRAALYHLRAGDRATRLAAYEEAITHLSRALALLEDQPETPERVRLKMKLHLALVSPLAMVHGFWAPERIDALRRAYELAQRADLGDSPERYDAVATAAYYAIWSAQRDLALQLSKQVLELAAASGDEQRTLSAHALLGAAHWTGGELVPARQHLERALAGAGCPHPLKTDLLLGFDIGVLVRSWRALVLWLQGYPDQALQQLHQAVDAAGGADAATIVYARMLAGFLLFLFGRDLAGARQQVEALRQVAIKGLPVDAWFGSLETWTSSRDGEEQQALAQMRQSVATFRLLGTGAGHAVQLLLMAQRSAGAGDLVTAQGAVAESLAWMEANGARLLEPEALRLRGELLLLDPDGPPGARRQAEECFRGAIAAARRQEARWWELRATTSLYRLLSDPAFPASEAAAEARAMLVELYGWFREGFAMQDLREARHLLDRPGADRPRQPLSDPR